MRPDFFAAYIARSAAAINAVALRPALVSATPRLAVRPTGSPSTVAQRASIFERMRSPTARACATFGAVEQDDEFLAAVASKRVVAAQLLVDDRDDGAQARVARGVAVAVVDALEVVEVDEQQRERGAVGGEARARGLDARGDRARGSACRSAVSLGFVAREVAFDAHREQAIRHARAEQ